MATNPLARAHGRQFVADFETNSTPGLLLEYPVWAWAIADVENPRIVARGRDITSFMYYVSKLSSTDIYFHNLKFDGEFIVYWLLNNGFQHVTTTGYKPKQKGQFFTCVISGQGAWYALRVHFDRDKEINFKDSLKRIPLKVSQMPKAYGLAISKGEIDYALERPCGYTPTVEEWEYVEHDVLVVAQALNIMDSEGMEKLTVGANAFNFYRRVLAKSDDYIKQRYVWSRHFPELSKEDDMFCRAAYLGGWVYANPKYTNKLIGSGRVYDVNSMYPAVMLNERYPHGEPVAKGAGRIPSMYETEQYVYFQRATFKARLRPGCLPMLKIRDSLRYFWFRYITDTGYSPRTNLACEPYVTATLTNVDWHMLLKYYDVDIQSYDSYMVFKADYGLFDDYINYWAAEKIQAGEQGNKGKRTIAKLYLNNLYGKFGTNPYRSDKTPYMGIDGVVHYLTKDTDSEIVSYVPVAALCTAYARRNVISAAFANYDRFLYADTDSIHLLGESDPVGMDIDPYRLGAWDNEANFTAAKYLGAKCYAEKINGLWKITVAGMPEECKENLNVEKDFKIGYTAKGKLLPRRYPGGVLLEETTFMIKPR